MFVYVVLAVCASIGLISGICAGCAGKRNPTIRIHF